MSQKATGMIGRVGATPTIKGVLMSLIIMIVLLLVISIVYNSNDLNPQILYAVQCVIWGISSFFGGWTSSKGYGKKGMKNGFLIGCILFVGYTLIGCLIHGLNISGMTVVKGIVTILAGTLGGIVGINLSAKRKIK